MNIENVAIPIYTYDDLDDLMIAIGDSQCVMIGEASHGTKEFHKWRYEMIKKLINEKDFRFIAIEWDWPDCYEVNKYVKGFTNKNPKNIFKQFKRWPEWMWCNTESLNFIKWLRKHNMMLSIENRVGFYGLDLFSLQSTIKYIYDYLNRYI